MTRFVFITGERNNGCRRLTGVLATCFIATSLTLAILAGNARTTTSITDAPPPAQTQPAEPSTPVVPLAK